MWLDGDKLETIAHAFNCSLTTVSDRARRFDLPARQRGGRRRVVDYTNIAPTIEQRWEQGITVRAIARELHVSVRTITRLTRHLTPRPPGRSKRGQVQR